MPSTLDIASLFAPEKPTDELLEAEKLVGGPAPTTSPILFDPEQAIEAPALPRVCKIDFDAVNLEHPPQERGASTSRIELPDLNPAEPETPLSEEPSVSSPAEGSSSAQDHEFEYREIVVDKNGQPRQAGATTAEGRFVAQFKKRAEENLFVFIKGVLGRFFLTSHFHRDICEFIQTCPPFRKLILMPREHAKTTIVAGGLPAHILLQPATTNIYFPGMEGSECRILLAGETEKMAKKNLRVVKNVFDENRTFRALWPHRCWEGGKKQAKEWSTEQIIIPRDNEWPDPTIRAVGVGGAITGARPNVMLKDDLVSFKAMNSEVVMDEAIEWHKASRALLDKYEVESGLQSLEWLVGTRWSVFDLYSYIIDNDPSVEVNDERFHRIIREGKILWSEKYTQADIEQLQLEHGSMFYLLYLNSASDPSLTDFDMEAVRKFAIVGGKLLFEGDPRDSFLRKRMESICGTGEAAPPKMERGQPLDLMRLSEAIKGGMGCRIRG